MKNTAWENRIKKSWNLNHITQEEEEEEEEEWRKAEHEKYKKGKCKTSEN